LAMEIIREAHCGPIRVILVRSARIPLM
jgi:hypothetical protein